MTSSVSNIAESPYDIAVRGDLAGLVALEPGLVRELVRTAASGQ